jgi:hypothetical protein
MARPAINLDRMVRQILAHTTPLPPEAAAPLTHYTRTGRDIRNLLRYIEDNFRGLTLDAATLNRHMTRLYAMAMSNLIETFERYLKEVAAACVDFLAQYVLDDRFNVFRIQGAALAAHFGTDTLGRSLCESATWLDCDEINERFRRLLADPFQKDGKFYLFPRQGQEPAAERHRFETLSIIWQLRHTGIHNVGVITQSDAIKLRLLVRAPVAPLRVLSPTRDDIRYLKRFLDETAESCNRRIGERLAELLTMIHTGDPTLFVPREQADRISETFGFALTVAGAGGTPPP